MNTAKKKDISTTHHRGTIGIQSRLKHVFLAYISNLGMEQVRQYMIMMLLKISSNFVGC